MSATIKSVAEYAGVSIKTVSRVINNEGTVKQDTLVKVQNAIAALNYKPNKAARDLAGRDNYVLGYVYDNPNAYYILAMQNGILDECRACGYELLIHPCDANSHSIIDELLAMVESARLAGVILSPPLSEMPDILSALDEKGILYVRIMSGEEALGTKHPCVLVNDFRAAFAITEHLIKQGHRDIAFIAGEQKHNSTRERQRGYLSALQTYGIDVQHAHMLQGTYSFGTGVEKIKQLLAQSDRPTAVFACNDEIAAGALFGARMEGVDVPSQLAIAGFENSPFSRQTFPPLTTASQPTAQIAQQATASLIQSLQSRRRGGNTQVGASHVFVPELVVRESTSR
ncbi:LacI family DNA-binding transcriptional regulator [Alteromonas gilva]|uniref:LacI family DNA-binding transcriptional regulator n=1 Tax=Alteromonas gilva TaxID=2987522 RepID=A0ABT5KYG0_9ALTE|nr:LacI family DNA-binding transcriptional regulator [Alteromonas gilva]MDC8829810.1 LacI family DNA-binding transcriptional regulator [Alteromonas gilva]